MKIVVTEEMVDAAMDTGCRIGILSPRPDRESIRKMLQTALQLIARSEVGNPYPLEVIGPTRNRLRARFVRMGEHRGYMTVETKDGQALNIHANEVLNRRGDR